MDSPSHYNAEAPPPSKESSLSTDDMEKFCQLVEETRISRKLNQEQLASELCESYRAPFPKNQLSVHRFVRSMCNAEKMLILYPIFKEWIDGEHRNDSPRRSISPTTFSRLGRRLSQDECAIRRHEYGRDPKRSEQKEIDLAKRLGIQKGVVHWWYRKHRSYVRRVERNSKNSAHKSKNAQDKTEEEPRDRDFRD